MELTKEELDLLREWYNAVEDLNPTYLDDGDKELYNKIIKKLKTLT